MPLNKDGLEAGQPVDFETIQKVKQKHREGLKNAKSESKRKPAKASKREQVRGQDKPGVSVLPDSEEPKEAE